MIKAPKLETILKTVGAIPTQTVTVEPKPLTPFQLERNKALNTFFEYIGAIPTIGPIPKDDNYTPEPIEWNVLREGAYNGLKTVVGYLNPKNIFSFFYGI